MCVCAFVFVFVGILSYSDLICTAWRYSDWFERKTPCFDGRLTKRGAHTIHIYIPCSNALGTSSFPSAHGLLLVADR